MSDIGKLQRPETSAMDAGELGHDSPGAVLDDPAAARERAGDELKFRASGGARGVAPMQRLMDERRAMGGKLAARVQRKADGGGAGNVEIPEGGGARLPAGVRAKMEPKLGADLSDVQVHTGGASAKAAAGLGARAFTVGSDVHFNSGEFAPGSKEGDRLLAHELTHVVQGKKSGVQRKADDGGGGEHAHGAEHGGGEVSHPDEPAEKEADAVADGVTDQLHGGGKGGKGKGKEKDKEGGGAHDLGAQAHESGGAGGAHGGGGGGGEHAPHEAAHVLQQGAGPGGGGGQAPAEKPAAISAKFAGVGRKIFRTKGPAPSPTPAPNPKAGDKAADPKQAQIDKAKNCKTDADVDAFCAQDPIATQKLADVKGETNMEADNAAVKKGFYQKMATWIQANAETVNPKTIFNQCMNNLAGEWKFKGKKLDLGKLPKSMQRTQGLKGFYYTAADQNYYMNQIAPSTDKNAAYALWKIDAKTNPMAHVDKGARIMPSEKGGGTWFTPDSYKLGNASDAGFGQLLELAALQPEWFPEGNIVFEVDVAQAKGAMEARRPTAFDGMQSSLWVSRPTGETYGVTGGGANEFLAGNVPVSAMKNARVVAPEDDTQSVLKKAVTDARDLALQQDPELKKRLDGADAAMAANKDPAMKDKLAKAKSDLEGMIPNLTDMFLRGNAPGTIGAAVKQMLDAIKKSTESERAAPSAARGPAEIVAPSVKAAGGGGGGSSTPKSDPSAKGPKK